MTADSYLRRVDAALRDLPWKMRGELVSELRIHLAEIPAESDLEERLGTPEEYAADLRTAAGIERRHGPVAFLRARRPRNVILTVVALTTIGLAIGAVVWAQSYQPLGFAFGYRFPAGSVDAPAGDSASVVFHEGRPFQLGITVLNNGRFAVRVLGVPYPPALPFKARLMMSSPLKNTGGMHGPYTRFRPFDLKPGRVVFLFLEGVYANCHFIAPGGSTGLSDFPVRYRFLSRTSTADIPLPEELAIVFPRHGACRR